MNDRLLSSWIMVAGALGFGYYYYRLQAGKVPPSQGAPPPNPGSGGNAAALPPAPPAGQAAPPLKSGDWMEWPAAAKKAFQDYQDSTPARRQFIDALNRKWIQRGSLGIDGGESGLAIQVG